MAEVVSRRSIVYDILFDVESGKKSAKEAQAALGKLGAEFDKASTEVENFSSQTLNSVARLRALKAQINNFRGSEKEFQALTLEAAKLQDQLSKTNQRIAVLASSTRNIEALASGVRGAVGLLTAAQGATALFGAENKNLQQSILKVQGALALLQGTQEAVRLVTEQSALKTVLLEKAQKAYAFATTGATTATKLFRTALLATGAGVVLAALGTIVVYWKDIAKWIGISKDKQEDLNDATKEYLDINSANIRRVQSNLSLAQKNTSELTDELSRLNKELENLPTQAGFDIIIGGQTFTQDLDKTRKQLQEQIKIIQDELKKRKELIKGEKTDLAETIDVNLPTFRESIEEITKLLEEAKKRQEDYLNSIGATIKTTRDVGDVAHAALTRQFDDIKALQEAYFSLAETSANILGSLSKLAVDNQNANLALASAEILTSQSVAIAKAISSAKGLTGFDYAAQIGVAVAAAVSAFAQVFTLFNQARAATSAAQANASAFAEGEIDIHRTGERKGKDSIPAVLMPGESVMTTAETATYKPILEAIRAGTLDDLIHQNYVAPELAVNALEHAKNDSREERDYSERFYKQLLATGEGNGINKRALNHLQSIDRKLTGGDFTKKYRR